MIPIIGPSDEPTEPRVVCRGCGARYYGERAAEICEGYHLLEVLDVDE